MDAQRFDNLARSLAGRLSRRNALRRASAAATASLLAAAGLRDATEQAFAQATPTPAAGQGVKKEEKAKSFYSTIRRYTLTEPAADVRKAFETAYLEGICGAPGFVAYFTVEDAENEDTFATVLVFESKKDLETFEKAETPWLAQNVGDLLPAPDDTITGESLLKAGDDKAFRDTCPGAAEKPEKPAKTQQGTGGGGGGNKPAKPGKPPKQGGGGGTGGGGTGGGGGGSQPTQEAEQPAEPGTPESGCKDQGCPCTTGTRRPCKGDLICCPSGDTPGGPGVCQPQADCPTSQCIANDTACPATCAAGADCADCCSGYCGGGALCAEPPVACTGAGCACNGGVQGACDAGLVCCQEDASIPGGPGTCMTEAECTPPCTGVGCACNGGVQGACDLGLVCCQTDPSVPGGPGTCQTEAVCNPPAPICTDNGGACDPTCNWGDTCTGCCSGFCNASGVCDNVAAPPPCIDSGAGCDPTCNWGDACTSCCSGFCDASGICGDAAAQAAPEQVAPESVACTGEGCECVDVCDAGLICCAPADGSGAPATCQVAC